MKEVVGIHIGDFYASRTPVVISTLLGSCVAVCLHDPAAGIGGMNHILRPGRADTKDRKLAARFSFDGVEQLIEEVLKQGARRDRLEAKVFGGGRSLASVSEALTVGGRNTDSVFECLMDQGIKVVSQDIGGDGSRRILFHTDTGDVFVKRNQATANPDKFDFCKRRQAGGA